MRGVAPPAFLVTVASGGRVRPKGPVPLGVERRVHLWRGAATLALVLSGCIEPLQSGGVFITGSPEGRFDLACRFQRGEEASVCLPPARSSLVRALRAGERLGGDLAAGREGDWLVENGEIAFVVSSGGAVTGSADAVGHLVDIADAAVRRDEISRLVPSIGGRPVRFATTSAGVDPSGVAWVEGRGHAAGGRSVEVVTRYELAPEQRGIAVTHVVTNRGRASVRLVEIGDALYWGAAAPIADPQTFGAAAAAVGPELSYAVLSLNQAAVVARDEPGGARVSTEVARPLDRGGTLRSRGFVAVGRRGDELALASELTFLSGGTLGGLALSPPPPPVADASPRGGLFALTVWPLGDDGAPRGRPWSLLAGGAPGSTIVECPPGDYAIAQRGAPEGIATRVRVTPGEVARVSVAAYVPAPAPAPEPAEPAEIPPGEGSGI